MDWTLPRVKITGTEGTPRVKKQTNKAAECRSYIASEFLYAKVEEFFKDERTSAHVCKIGKKWGYSLSYCTRRHLCLKNEDRKRNSLSHSLLLYDTKNYMYTWVRTECRGCDWSFEKLCQEHLLLLLLL